MPRAGPHEPKETWFTEAMPDPLGSEPASLRGPEMLRKLGEAAAACASRHAHCQVTMMKADNIELRRPPSAAGGVRVRARVAFSGRSSMTVLAEVVDAESPQAGPAAGGRFMLVAVDGDGVPVPISHKLRPEEAAS